MSTNDPTPFPAGGSPRLAGAHRGEVVNRDDGFDRDAIGVTLGVVALHAAALFAWLGATPSRGTHATEFAVQETIRTDLQGKAAATTPANPVAPAAERERRTPPAPARTTPAAPPASAISSSAASSGNASGVNAAAPETADADPDYRATYLDNPAPPYPLAARRMGLQGTVVLSVEVLQNGQCGEISVMLSSGHALLDTAALQTVKSWRFTPARHDGVAVTRRFKVPIVFSLRDSNDE